MGRQGRLPILGGYELRKQDDKHRLAFLDREPQKNETSDSVLEKGPRLREGLGFSVGCLYVGMGVFLGRKQWRGTG